MSRASRLLDLLQSLRGHRVPVTGQSLANDLGISIRTLYRDIATLQAQGADIEGEPGLGYVLKPGFMLPPLMFSDEEIEALVLGSRWVADRADDDLAEAARRAIAKIAAVLPKDLKDNLDATTLVVGPVKNGPEDIVNLALIRRAIRTQHKLTITYLDLGGTVTERVIWPFGLGFFDSVRVIMAWCELRQDHRHFRTDRIISLIFDETRYTRRRAVLMNEWRVKNNVPDRSLTPARN
jgi:predicted DNA-binding transcriptional regulator YafY